MAPKILVVDDEPGMRDMLVDALTLAGHQARAAIDGFDALKTIRAERFDLIISDVNMPRMNGFDLLQDLREHGDNTPVILLTARADRGDVTTGLKYGADDYVTKPFNSRELLARVKIVLRGLRGRGPKGGGGETISFGRWTFDIAHRRLQGSDGKREILTRGEFDLLAALASHPGVVLSRERLMQTVSHRSWDPNDRTIDVLISRLRDKLEDDPKHPEIITTVRGEGYVLIAGDGGR